MVRAIRAAECRIPIMCFVAELTTRSSIWDISAVIHISGKVISETLEIAPSRYVVHNRGDYTCSLTGNRVVLERVLGYSLVTAVDGRGSNVDKQHEK